MEASEEPVSEKFDRFVRLAILSISTDRDYDRHDMIEVLSGNQKPIKLRRLELQPNGEHYEVQYA